ncbi:hypothetical protein IHE45_04G108100 [Dioscorea alata]|uniref:Uncharacterized protein n=1 Tax=Dioscorea alata TaxID=55571 RepID=A0ACB7WF65_DIOAL|nr:hypothetical protein IHE45_04G108100 [Dioscorea alata]
MDYEMRSIRLCAVCWCGSSFCQPESATMSSGTALALGQTGVVNTLKLLIYNVSQKSGVVFVHTQKFYN